MAPFGRIIPWLFECHHRKLSRVFTINQRTYQVCLDCGRELDYPWERMGSVEPYVPATRVATEDSRRRVQASIV
jgi:hypothetical protein